jgi:AcrR family transcriptional regulator
MSHLARTDAATLGRMPVAGSLGHRHRKKASTRQAITEAGLDLFERAGYDKVTVEQIAERADVSPRTVYRYFPTKSAIVFDIQASWMVVFREADAATQVDDDPLARARRVAVSVAAFAMDHPDPARRAYAVARQSMELQAMGSRWEHEWRMATATMLASLGHSRAVTVAGIVMGMISASVELWLDGGTSTDLVDMISDGFDLIERGTESLTNPESSVTTTRAGDRS